MKQNNCTANDILITTFSSMLEPTDEVVEFSSEFQRKMDKLMRVEKIQMYPSKLMGRRLLAVIICAVILLMAVMTVSSSSLFKPVNYSYSQRTQLTRLLELEYNASSGGGYYLSNYSEKYPQEIAVAGDTTGAYYDLGNYRRATIIKNLKSYYEGVTKVDESKIETIDVAGNQALMYCNVLGEYSIYWQEGDYIIFVRADGDREDIIDFANSIYSVEELTGDVSFY